jgi:hypothetical protein
VAVVADEDLTVATGQRLARDPAAADVDLDVEGLRMRGDRDRRGSRNRHGTRLLDRGGNGSAAAGSRFRVMMQIGHRSSSAGTAVVDAFNAGWLLNQRPPYNR